MGWSISRICRITRVCLNSSPNEYHFYKHAIYHIPIRYKLKSQVINSWDALSLLSELRTLGSPSIYACCLLIQIVQKPRSHYQWHQSIIKYHMWHVACGMWQLVTTRLFHILLNMHHASLNSQIKSASTPPSNTWTALWTAGPLHPGFANILRSMHSALQRSVFRTIILKTELLRWIHWIPQTTPIYICWVLMTVELVECSVSELREFARALWWSTILLNGRILVRTLRWNSAQSPPDFGLSVSWTVKRSEYLNFKFPITHILDPITMTKGWVAQIWRIGVQMLVTWNLSPHSARYTSHWKLSHSIVRVVYFPFLRHIHLLSLTFGILVLLQLLSSLL